MPKVYDIMMVDPPWPLPMAGKRRSLARYELDYPTLSIPDNFALLDAEVFPQLAPAGSTVFLWTVERFLPDAELAMLARGFKLHVRMVWDKGTGLSPAFSVRWCHEYLLWFYRSPFPHVSEAFRGHYSTVFRGGAREHSRKPDHAYEIVENLYPYARRLDVFSREARPGWDQWGNQPDFFMARDSHAPASLDPNPTSATEVLP